MTRARNTADEVSLITAKGDLLAGSASGVQSKLAVGANNTVLTADSATTTGIKWATASGIGTYSSFTPTVKQGATTMTLYAAGSDGQNYYTQSGKFVHCMGELYMNSTGSSSGAIEMTLPVNIDTTVQSVIFSGSGYLRDSSASLVYAFILSNNGNNNKVFFSPAYANGLSGNPQLGASGFTAALDTGDTIRYSFIYRSV